MGLSPTGAPGRGSLPATPAAGRPGDGLSTSGTRRGTLIFSSRKFCRASMRFSGLQTEKASPARPVRVCGDVPRPARDGLAPVLGRGHRRHHTPPTARTSHRAALEVSSPEGTRTRRRQGWLPSTGSRAEPAPRLPSVHGSRSPGLSATSLQPLLGHHGRFLRPPSQSTH